MLSGVGMRLNTLELPVPGRAEDGRLASNMDKVELRPNASAR